MGQKIKRILIANRGEIAVRVIKTCRLLGIETVVVSTPPDKGSHFTFFADFCHELSSSDLKETYLNPELMVQICKEYECDAVHPGYGFLSENANFAKLCTANDICFIGPPADVIDLMGNKIAARKFIEKLGIPLLKGVTGSDHKKLSQEAAKMKFPLLIKAAAGGGGRGMRIARKKEDLEKEIKSASSEALNAFGDGSVYVERYLENCRHIEVQLISDKHGNHLHLFERECSIQRRHQKVIEECPSSCLNDQERQRICAAAIKIAEGVNYENAGTIEFLWADGDFFFLEMNTRLQVEHPVSEMVTGIDLVKMQIEAAEGKRFTLKQNEISIRGHAIEGRVYAEDPYNNFMPSGGTISRIGKCDLDGVRVETSFLNGNSVPTEYDSMLAKVAAWSTNRNEAAIKLEKALAGLPFYGVKNNCKYIRQILTDKDFIDCQTFTNFLEKHDFSNELPKEIPFEIIAAALLFNSSSEESAKGNPWTS